MTTPLPNDALAASTVAGPDRMNVREFRELGLLQEINRRLLHPMGLALDVAIERDGSESLGGVWDYRDSRVGVRFDFEPDVAKASSVDALFESHRAERERRYGWHVQPAGELRGDERRAGPLRIYVASSWRNELQPDIVERLRAEGFEVYDFRNPPGRTGFSWREIDPNWKAWDAREYVNALHTTTAQAGFASDMNALRDCDVCLLVQPCGISAHLEFGWAIGAGKLGVVLVPGIREPELMLKMASTLSLNLDDAVGRIHRYARELGLDAVASSVDATLRADAQAVAADAEKPSAARAVAGTSLVCTACGCRWKRHAPDAVFPAGSLQLYDAAQRPCAQCDNGPSTALRPEEPSDVEGGAA